MTTRAQLQDVAHVLEFTLAGNARLTLVSRKTGARFTFRVRAAEDGPRHYVSLLTSADNENGYQYMGTVFTEPSGARVFRHGRRSHIGPQAPSVQAFGFFWHQLTVRGAIPSELEVWHEGSCGKCGRPLTVPESIARGLGPVCAGGA